MLRDDTAAFDAIPRPTAQTVQGITDLKQTSSLTQAERAELRELFMLHAQNQRRGGA